MNRTRVHLISLTAVLLSALGAAGFAHYTSNAQETKPPNTLVNNPVLKDIANYKQWTRVNDVPLPVTFSVMSVNSLASDVTGI